MTHLDFLTLADYWIADDEAPAVEEHLFQCPECSQTLDWVARMAKGIRSVVREGDLSWILTPEFLARLTEEGLRVRSYAPPNGGEVRCTVTRQDDLLMGRLRSDLSQVTRLDAILCSADGAVRMRLEDVAFRPSNDGELVFNQPLSQARAMGDDTLVIKLFAVDAASERPVGEFTFKHSRTVE
jgi:hypothetical protein